LEESSAGVDCEVENERCLGICRGLQ